MDPHVDGRPFETVLSIEGTFDPLAESALRVEIARLPRDMHVVLDFSRAWRISDLALAALARRCGSRVVLRGLTQHQQRMLQYLGIDRGAERHGG